MPTFFGVPPEKRMMTPARPISYSRLPHPEIVFSQTEAKHEDDPSDELTILNLGG
jgi:hypothetical protein